MSGRLTFLMFLLFAVSAQKVLGDPDDVELINRLHQMENDQNKQGLIITSLIDQIHRLEDTIEDTLDRIETQVHENGLAIKSPGCQQLLQWNLEEPNFFSADEKHYYVKNGTQVTWYEARDFCTQRGMQMARTKTQSEMDAVLRELREYGFNFASFWVSASDIGRTAGQYRWLDGTSVVESTWYTGQPNSAGEGNESCVYLRTTFGKLFDVTCAYDGYILCEVPAPLSSCF